MYKLLLFTCLKQLFQTATKMYKHFGLKSLVFLSLFFNLLFSGYTNGYYWQIGKERSLIYVNNIKTSI